MPRIETTIGKMLEWAGGLDRKITEEDEIEFSISDGYVIFETHGPSGNGSFRGAYHPNVVCEGGGICIHCGCTLEFD